MYILLGEIRLPIRINQQTMHCIPEIFTGHALLRGEFWELSVTIMQLYQGLFAKECPTCACVLCVTTVSNRMYSTLNTVAREIQILH